MPLEMSVLNTGIIKTLVNDNYGYTVKSVESIPLGTANCYHVYTENQSFFLKEFQSTFEETDLICETELVAFLRKHGFLTAEYIPLTDGRFYFSYSDHFICMQEYIDGNTYANDLPEKLMPQAAELLGKLHSLLRDYELPIDMDRKWLGSFSPAKNAKQYDKLLAALKKHRTDTHYEQIKADLTYKKQLLNKIEDYRKYYNGITYCATHGDYTCVQLICDETQIKAVIDFSSAHKLPVVWEIMRSYIQSCSACKDETAFNINNFCDYVSHYLKYASLTAQDLESMPYVYLYQLARSKYGYKEYLITNTENKNDLLEFAFWRTDICRVIEKQATNISRQLKYRFENTQ